MRPVLTRCLCKMVKVEELGEHIQDFAIAHHIASHSALLGFWGVGDIRKIDKIKHEYIVKTNRYRNYYMCSNSGSRT